MNVSKVTAALKTAQEELNLVTDEEFKARRLAALRPLTLAGNAIELAQKHLATATDRTKGKGGDAPAQTEGAATTEGQAEGGTKPAAARRTTQAAK